jgi:molybdopterin molybdotransferase
VDGYAVRARDTFGASDSLPAYLTLTGEIAMGSAPGIAIGQGQTALIHTGGMLPEGADAVVMLEWTQTARPGEVEVLRAVAPGENSLQAGQDVEVGEVVVPKGRRLRAAELGGLMALGMTKIPVRLPPKVGILSTGDEVIDPQNQPEPGQVRDVNSYTLSALVEQHGGEPVRFGILPDRRDAIEAAVTQALDTCDMVTITAGSSASTRDLTAEIIARLGPPGVLAHGVNVKPGKPTIVGACRGKAVIGLPGNPVSTLVIARLFVAPVIERLLGMERGSSGSTTIRARLSVNLPSQAGREDWTPARLARAEDGGWHAEPIFYQSNLIFTLAKADGLIYTPANAVGLESGADVLVELL